MMKLVPMLMHLSHALIVDDFGTDQSKCIVHEIYANSEAVFAHSNGLASQTILPKIFSLSRISKFEVYGNPSKKLQKVLTSFSPHTYNLFTGFTRIGNF